MNKTTLFKIITCLVFFCLGILISYNSSQKSKQEKKIETPSNKEEANLKQENLAEPGQPLAEKSYQVLKEEAPEEGGLAGITQTISSSGKFTIAEAGKITASKIRAQTGEIINFSITIKNQGDKGKYFSHLCFNHSGGVTFGCLNGPQGATLDPDKEFSLGGSTVFSKPGTYSVWLTWSQDSTNFYRPLNSSAVMVYIE